MPTNPSKTFLCPCHDVTLDDIFGCWKKGIRHPEAIKRVTGITMGDCQGKMCLAAFSETLASLSGEPSESIQMPSIRPPLYPVRMGALAGPDLADAEKKVK